jgi:CubicO group peptidase (beta-lactamase class C family)
MSSPNDSLSVLLDSLDEPFSGVVALRQGSRRPVLIARGLAHRPTGTANEPTTRFAIASGTKGFTATAVLQMIQDGRLSFDATVDELLPGIFPRFASGVTVRHLITHTSGIPDYCDEEAGCDFEAPWTERPVYTMRRLSDFVPMFNNQPMKFPPGERFSYSNSGFIVLGLILEELSGLSYAAHVERSVFHAGEMTSSGFFASDALPLQAAIGYIRNDDGSYRSNVFAVPVVGGSDGGAFTTAEDLIRFWDAVFNGRLINPPMVKEVLAGDIGPTGNDGLRYSLGFWRANDWRETPTFVLIGGDPGVSFYSAYSPGNGDCFAILSNSEDGAWRALPLIRELFAEPAGE